MQPSPLASEARPNSVVRCMRAEPPIRRSTSSAIRALVEGGVAYRDIAADFLGCKNGKGCDRQRVPVARYLVAALQAG
jgi:hypothetical protein